MAVVAAQLVAQITVQGADKAKTDLSDMGKHVDATGKSFNLVQSIFHGFGSAASSAGGLLRSALMNPLSAVTGMASSAGHALQSILGGAFSAAGSIAGGLATGLGAASTAIIGLGVETSHMAGDFEAAMIKIKTSAGETGTMTSGNLKIVADGILKTARDAGTSADDLAQAMYYIESSGARGADGLKMLQAAARGAKLENVDTMQVTRALLAVMQGYHMPASEATTAMNSLVVATAHGGASLNELTGAMAAVLPTASSLHIPFEQVASAIGVMTNKQTTAQQASQNLAHVLLALEAPNSVAAGAMKLVGTSAQQVRDALVNQGLPQALQLIEDHVGKKFPKDSVEYTEAMKNILGGIVGFKVAAQLTGPSLKEMQSNIAAVKNAARDGKGEIIGWAETQETLNLKLARAKEVIETTGIAIGTRLLPVAGYVVDLFSNLAEKAGEAFTSMLDWIQAKVVPQLQVFWQWIQAKILPALSDLWNWIEHQVVSALQHLWMWLQVDVVPILQTFWQWIQAKILPILKDLWNWLESQIISALQHFWKWLADSVIPALSDLWKWIDANVIPALQQLWRWIENSVVPALVNLWKWVSANVLPVLTELAKMIMEHVITALQQFWGWIEKNVIPALSDLWKWVSANVLPVLRQLGDLLMKQVLPALQQFSGWISSHIVDALNSLWKWIQTYVVPVLGWLKDRIEKDVIPALQRFWGWIQTQLIPALMDFWSFVVRFTLPMLDLIKEYAGKAGESLLRLRDSFDRLQSSLDKLFGGDGKKKVDSLKVLMEELKGIFMQLVTSIVAPLVVLLDTISHFADELSEVFDGITQIVNHLKQTWDDLVRFLSVTDLSRAAEPFEKLKKDILAIWDGMWKIIEGSINMLLAPIIGYLDGFGNFLFTLFQDISDNLVGHSIIPDMINAIVANFAGLPGRVMGVLAGLPNMVAGIFLNMAVQSFSWGTHIGDGIASGLRSMMGTVTSAATNVASSIASILHHSKPEIGPLANDDQWMPHLMQSMADGMNKNIGKVRSASLNVAATIAMPQAGNVSGLSIVPQRLQTPSSSQIIVQPPPIYLDGRLLASGLWPYLVDAVRYQTGSHHI